MGIEVSFSLRGDSLDPSEVMRSLRIEPTRGHCKGEDRSGPRFKGAWPHGWWSLESPFPQSEALEVHLVWILDKLEPKRGVIREILKHECTADLRIAFFSDCDQLGVSISAELVERITKLGASLELQGYTS